MKMNLEDKINHMLTVAKRIALAKDRGEPLKGIYNILGTTERTARKYYKLYKEGGEQGVIEYVKKTQHAIANGYKKANHKKRKTKRSESNSRDALYREYDGQSLFNKLMGIDVTKKHSMGQIWINDR